MADVESDPTVPTIGVIQLAWLIPMLRLTFGLLGFDACRLLNVGMAVVEAPWSMPEHGGKL